jgi:hypothetical protein
VAQTTGYGVRIVLRYLAFKSYNTMKLELITSVNELDGTCYDEFIPGKWLGKHWNPTSVYIDDDAFGLIAWLFEERVPGFNPYGPTEIMRSRIDHVIKGLNDFSKKGTQYFFHADRFAAELIAQSARFGLKQR